MAKTVELEKQLSEANAELEQLRVRQLGLLSSLSFPGALCTALCLSACLPVDLPAYLPVCLSVCLSVHPSVHPSICLSISLFLFAPPQCLCVCVSLFFGQSVKCACMWFVLLDHEERGTLAVDH